MTHLFSALALLAFVVAAPARAVVSGAPPYCVEGIVNRAAVQAQALGAFYSRSLIGEQIRLLARYVAIPSVSEHESARPQLTRAADFTAQMLRDAGVEGVVVEDSLDDTHVPVVYGATPHVPGLPTVLVYGHFDVAEVTPEQLAGWRTNPYAMTADGEWFRGRGIADDKAGIMSFISMLQTYRALNRPLPVNLVFLFEGGEESGTNLRRYLAEHAARFRGVEIAIVCDGTNRVPGHPVLEISARGAIFYALHVRPERPTPRLIVPGNRHVIRIGSGTHALHSGVVAGGAVPNPLVELARLVDGIPNLSVDNVRTNGAASQAPSFAEADVATAMTSDELRSHVEGLNVRHGLHFEVTPPNFTSRPVVTGAQGPLLRVIAGLFDEEQRMVPREIYEGVTLQGFPLGYNPAAEIFRTQIARLLDGVQLLGHPDTPQYRVARLPALNVGGIVVDEHGAHAAMLMRTVPGMDPARIDPLLRRHISRIALPPGYVAELEPGVVAAEPDFEDPRSEAMRIAIAAVSRAAGARTIVVEDGGSLPLLADLRRAIPGVVFYVHAVADTDSNTHAENEGIRLATLIRATRTNFFLIESIGQRALPFP